MNYSTHFRSFIVVTEQSLETCLWRLLKVTSVLVFDQTDATLPVENQRVIGEIPLTESECLRVWMEHALNQQLSLELLAMSSLPDDYVIKLKCFGHVWTQSHVVNPLLGKVSR